MTRAVVYVSGSITNGETLSQKHIDANVRVAMKAQHELFAMGFAVILPHLTVWSHSYYPEDYELYMENSLALVAKSDLVLRLPGESKGADREVLFAVDKRIPVFKSIKEIKEKFRAEPAEETRSNAK